MVTAEALSEVAGRIRISNKPLSGDRVRHFNLDLRVGDGYISFDGNVTGEQLKSVIETYHRRVRGRSQAILDRGVTLIVEGRKYDDNSFEIEDLSYDEANGGRA